MAKIVKNPFAGRSRISSKHQVTIPAPAFHAAGFRSGDLVKIEAEGAGQARLTKVEDLMNRYSGSIDSGGELRKSVKGLRSEWT